MSCPVCGRDDDPDPDTGYHGSDLCPDCQADGFIETADGSIVQERTGQEPDEFDQTRR